MTQVIHNPKTFSIKTAFKTAFDLIKENISTLVLIQLILIAGYVFIEKLLPYAPEKSIISQIIMGFVIEVVALSNIYIAFKLLSRKDIQVSDFSAGWKFIVPFFGTLILGMVATVLGIICLVIPGIIIAIRLCFSCYIVIDKKCGIVDALKLSSQLVKGSWWKCLGLSTLLTLLAIPINLIPYGVLAVLPLTTLVFASAYKQLSGSEIEMDDDVIEVECVLVKVKAD